ncbi:MAG TPA: hypothetical protein PKH58_08985 [Paludibacteraceae bacterium]|nr:hypothetical protein [Paludibacteraceae bacterium]
MNKIVKLFSILSLAAIMFASCSPEEFSLGKTNVTPEDLVEGIAFKIEHDAANPNIVYLKSLMGPTYTPLWNHPQGRSQEQTVTLNIPFAGTYNVQFGVETRGGIVYGDTVTFKVDNMFAGFISDPLWTKLSGGAGNEKTWYLDLDANSVSRYFLGPLYFYGTYDGWDQVTNGIKAPEGADSWNWNPDYKGNSWLMNAADFGSMTFNLKSGANLIVNHKTISSRGTQTGTYMIDVEKHTLKTQDAAILHDSNRDGVVVNWGDVKIMSLTDNTMQLAVLRDPTLSGEGACLLVYNFISKDYYDNWVPPVVTEPEPQLPTGWQTDISQTVSKSIKWVLSPETPFNWANLDGSLMNTDWTSADKYASWTGFNAAAAAGYAKFSLTLNSEEHTATYVAPDGTSTKGGYMLDDKGVYTFEGIKPNFVISGGWVTLSTTDANQWRITKIEKDPTGAVSGMWVGKRDPEKAEYMVYHLIPKLGSDAPDPLAAWKKALIGKTFKPDVNWFIDWINFDMTGGWTSAATFGTDYTSNGWVWNQKTSDIAKSASIKFEANGSDIKATLKQDVYDASGNIATAGYTISGKVTVNPDIPSLSFEFPMVNYTGSAGAWLNSENPKGANYTKALGQNEWLFVSHGGNTLSTIDTDGFWLGCVANAVAGGDSKDELLIFHFNLEK